MSTVKRILDYFKRSFKEWQQNDAFGKSAALAYYAVFSLPGLLVIIITVAGLVWSTQEVQKALFEKAGEIVGPEAAGELITVISNAQQSDQSGFAIIAGVVTIIFGATGVFFQLQKSLNDVWQVEPKQGAGIKEMLLNRLTALVLVLMLGFLLILSMLATTLISLGSEWIRDNLINIPASFLFLVQEVISLAVFTLLFALIFKVLPDLKISWQAVWPGALITALLFTLGKFLLGFYFGKTDPSSAFGSAGSIILLLLWAYYSGLIFLFGATFTHIYAQSKGYSFELTGVAQYNAYWRLRELEEQKEK